MAVATKPVEPKHEEHKHEELKPPVREPDAPPRVIAPLAIASIDDLSIDPDAVQGSRHNGPLLSGAPEDGAAGIAMLHKRVKILFSYGSFSIPVRFPPSAILTTFVVQIQQSYNGVTPKLNLGTTLNGVDSASVDLSVAPIQVFTNVASVLPSNWTMYLSQALGAGNTAGKCTALISYSVPAKVLPS